MVSKFYKDFAAFVEKKKKAKENVNMQKPIHLFSQAHMLEENQAWQIDKIAILVKAHK